ncbi:MAG: PilZ domain-containing protein [Desulfobacterales bacterium]|nr:MAG: PilZ domain-containing protein [Desulfobacterales bacterium]UCD89861.1 MAG: PilZ domain-containing protein [Desulfobacterales bacterium]
MKKKDVRDRLIEVTSAFSKSQMEKSLHALENTEQTEPAEEQESSFFEKREHIRIEASVYGIFETKNEQFRALTKNVSMGGVLIDPETDLSYHEYMDMTFFHTKFNIPLRTTGRVVRVDPDGVVIQFDQVIPVMSSL